MRTLLFVSFFLLSSIALAQSRAILVSDGAAESVQVAGPGDGLWLRLFGDASQLISPDPLFAVHPFSAAVWAWQQGDEPRDTLVVWFDLRGRDLTDLDQLTAKFSGTRADRADGRSDLHMYAILVEEGLWTRGRFNSRMGTTW